MTSVAGSAGIASLKLLLENWIIEVNNMPDLMRPRALTPLKNLRRELDTLFSDYFSGDTVPKEEVMSNVWTPRTDVSETDTEYIIRMDLPGMKKEDVTVKIEDHRLTVSGTRAEEEKSESEDFLRMERSYGTFYRSISLPHLADVNAVKAKFANGELRIWVTKIEESKPQTVLID